MQAMKLFDLAIYTALSVNSILGSSQSELSDRVLESQLLLTSKPHLVPPHDIKLA